MQHRGEMSSEKGSSSPLALCRVDSLCFHNELCSVAVTVHGDDSFVAGPRQDIAKMGCDTQEKMGDP